MNSWEMRILGGSYSNEEGNIVIELYGKTRANESAVVRYSGFLVLKAMY